MPLPGISDEKDVRLLLKKVIEDPELIVKFAVVASGPKEGELILSKKERLKRTDVQTVAEADARKANGGKPVKLDVIAGECQLQAAGATVLRLVVHGKAVAKAVSCIEHLLTRGPYKTVGFTTVVLTEVEEPTADGPTPPPRPVSVAPPPSSTSSTPPNSPPPPPPSPPLPDSLEGRFASRLKALKPNLDKVLSHEGASRAEVQKTLLAVTQSGKSRDFEAAIKSLDLLEKQVAKVLEEIAGKSPDAVSSASVFNQRLKDLLPRLKSAAGTVAGDQAKLRASEAGVLAKKGDFSGANALLDQVEQLLQSAGDANAPRSEKTSTQDGPQVAFTKSRLQWDAARKSVHDELTKLEQSILATFGAVPGIPKARLDQLAQGTKKLYTLLDNLDERLIWKLDECLMAKTLEEQAKRRQEAATIVKEYQTFVGTNPLIVDIDSNPFTPIDVQGQMNRTLADLASKLT